MATRDYRSLSSDCWPESIGFLWSLRRLSNCKDCHGSQHNDCHSEKPDKSARLDKTDNMERWACSHAAFLSNPAGCGKVSEELSGLMSGRAGKVAGASNLLSPGARGRKPGVPGRVLRSDPCHSLSLLARWRRRHPSLAFVSSRKRTPLL